MIILAFSPLFNYHLIVQMLYLRSNDRDYNLYDSVILEFNDCYSSVISKKRISINVNFYLYISIYSLYIISLYRFKNFSFSVMLERYNNTYDFILVFTSKISNISQRFKSLINFQIE